MATLAQAEVQFHDLSRPVVNPWVIAFTVMLSTFIEVLDTSIANVALPHIAGSLSAGVDESTWVLTSYLVSNAIVLPLTGWFSWLFGRKRFYIACVLMVRQANMLAFIDVFWILGVICFAMIPLMFLIKSAPPPSPATAAP